MLKLPHGAEINMVIPCGIRDGNKGIWGERCRVPLMKFIVEFKVVFLIISSCYMLGIVKM